MDASLLVMQAQSAEFELPTAPRALALERVLHGVRAIIARSTPSAWGLQRYCKDDRIARCSGCLGEQACAHRLADLIKGKAFDRDKWNPAEETVIGVS